MSWARRRSLAIRPPEGAGFYASPDPAGGERPRVPERRFKFWVKREQLHGGNVGGEANNVEVARSGALIIHLGRGKRRILSPGTWSEVESQELWNQGGDL